MAAKKRSTVFPPDVAQAIQSEASRRGITPSELIRASVVLFLNQAGAYPTTSGTDSQTAQRNRK